ncbi:hypothetical protein [Cellulomonas flavigena]|uniref:hypothetical protein n=1 Tax=Cellulomonas flavigena TaxID=1711 RepID=UPI00165132B0|nr:hypothetical protein [Cellulomonas flavigena]
MSLARSSDARHESRRALRIQLVALGSGYRLVHATPSGKVRIDDLQLDPATLEIRVVDQ